MRIGNRNFIGWGNRQYYLKASCVYAKLMQQYGFAACGGHEIRRALRENLHGRFYLSPPGHLHEPIYDRQTGFWSGTQEPSVLGYAEGTRVVRRYSWSCIQSVARHLPFRCPICAGGENPLVDFEFALPADDAEQMICRRCWRAYVWDIDNLCDELMVRIKKLNKGIENAKHRRQEAQRAYESC